MPPPDPQRLSIAVDDRALLAQPAGGVAVYADTLRRTLRNAGLAPATITDRDGPGALWRPISPWGRLAAANPGARSLAAVAGAGVDPGGGPVWYRRDLFAEAQIHFTLYGRPLRVRCTSPPAIMHWTYPVPLTLVGSRNLYTIHDLIPLTHPQLTPIAQGRHRRLIQSLLRTARHIVTVSEDSRRALIAQGCAPASVTNAGQAVIRSGPAAPPPPAGLTPQGYLLICGTLERRKNLSCVLAAYRLSGVAIPLVIVGADGWGADALLSEIARTPGAFRRPWQDRDALEGLVRHARALLMPSLAEGFGLPVAEAMTLGVPVLTSAQGALAETAGAAALTVDPYDIPALARGISSLSNDEALRQRLIALGLARAEAFGWRRYAADLLALYSRVGATPV